MHSSMDLMICFPLVHRPLQGPQGYEPGFLQHPLHPPHPHQQGLLEQQLHDQEQAARAQSHQAALARQLAVLQVCTSDLFPASLLSWKLATVFDPFARQLVCMHLCNFCPMAKVGGLIDFPPVFQSTQSLSHLFTPGSKVLPG